MRELFITVVIHLTADPANLASDPTRMADRRPLPHDPETTVARAGKRRSIPFFVRLFEGELHDEVERAGAPRHGKRRGGETDRSRTARTRNDARGPKLLGSPEQPSLLEP